MWTASNYTCSILLMSSSGDRSSPLSFLALVWFTQAFSSSVSLSFISDSYGTEKKQPHHQDTIKTVDSFKAPLLLLHRCTVYCVCVCIALWVIRLNGVKLAADVSLCFSVTKDKIAGLLAMSQQINHLVSTWGGVLVLLCSIEGQMIGNVFTEHNKAKRTGLIICLYCKL